MSSTSLLRYKADYRTLVFVAAYYIIAYGGFITYMLNPELRTWTVMAPWVIVTAFSSFACAVIVHNTIHAPIFHKKSHNKWFQFVLSLAYGYSVSAYVPGHNFSHHKEVQSDKDNMRTSKARFKWHFLNQLLFFFIVTPDLLKAEKKFVAKMKKDKRDWYNQWLAEMILVNVVRIGLLFVNFPAALLFIWGPHIYAAWGIVGTNVWQHDGCDIEDKYNHSRTFTGGLLNFFLFNNGYHGAHHDRPSMHWSLLPAYHEKNIAPYIHPNLNQKNMITYLVKAYIYPGKRVNYDGSPYVLEPAVPDVDWVAELSVIDPAHKYDFGAEASSIDDILQTTEIKETSKVV
ncbi:fatty acid desaturase family protein [Aureispira anguillae]|uniref:Fatty acid desaturase n=1 Tax=Aureispira anguillae TaxID=2864201 RepID=A0A915YL55_9BACT|nr:fatty acid desaturase [Aureispira anguillae]BDS14962.1 fatty acid desaturase [Aureispira anguillae]